MTIYRSGGLKLPILFVCFNENVGIVPSGVLLPLMQWGGRTHYLLALVGNIVEVHGFPYTHLLNPLGFFVNSFELVVAFIVRIACQCKN